MGEEVSLVELVDLCAGDSLLFSKTFFPKTFRQDFAPFHPRMWSFVEKPIPPGKRLRMMQVFRGGAKTSFIRTLAAKRIAYAVSRTILIIGKSEGHAVRTLSWLRKAVQYNPLYASTFSLRPGAKWSGTEAEIVHRIDEVPISIVGMGITGSTRGLNIDDFRPDLILLDDVLDEENTSTEESRQKINELIYGALKESLAPASETPDAMMVGCQTPINRDDYSVKAEHDSEWDFLRIGCWTPETAELPIESQVSSWPSRWTDKTLRDEKRAALARNQASIWSREKECKVIAAEDLAFRGEWLIRFENLPEGMTHTLSIDPVPPPTKHQIAVGFEKKDYESLSVVGHYGPRCFVREVVVNRGHDPLWTITEFFRLARKYNILWAMVETVAYQAVLAWLLRQAMQARRQYYGILEFKDGHSKYHRIVSGLTEIASQGNLLIPPDSSPEGIDNSPGMAMFVQQFSQYPRVAHDDALESVAVAVTGAQGKLDVEAEGVTPTEIDRYGNPIEELKYIPGVHIAP